LTGADLLGRRVGFGEGLTEGLAGGRDDCVGEGEVDVEVGAGATEDGEGLVGAVLGSTMIAGPRFTDGGAVKPWATT
jgi:hypothetical protein